MKKFLESFTSFGFRGTHKAELLKGSCDDVDDDKHLWSLWIALCIHNDDFMLTYKCLSKAHVYYQRKNCLSQKYYVVTLKVTMRRRSV
jgi:hypothetical protein